MISPRWRKILRDVLGNKRRTLLVILSITVGVFAVGTVAIMRDIVTGDMVTSYLAANPPSAILYTDESFDDDLVTAIKRLPQVAEAEGRRQVWVTFQHPQSETWYPMRLFAAPDYEDMRISILKREEAFGPDPVRWPNPAVYPPPERQVLIERTSMLLTSQGLAPDARQGDTLLVETPSGASRKLGLAGMVYDSVHGAAPWTGAAYGYVTLDTLEWLGYPRTYNELHLLVSGDRTSVDHIEKVAEMVKRHLAKSGLGVTRVEVPTPGQLPQDTIFQALVYLLTALGVTSLLLSAFLLINTVSALLAQQARQIGVMKAIGATSAEVTRLYLGMVIVFGLAALALAAPLSAWAAREIINFLSYLVNFTLGEFSLSPTVLLLQAALAIFVPLGAGLAPILAGARVTVQEAITSYGVSGREFGASRLDRFIKSLTSLPAPLALSVRNALRNKGRLALTLITLALAGASFIAVMNVRHSLQRTVDEVLQYLAFDIAVDFNQPYRLNRLEPLAMSLPGVEAVEGWGGAAAYRIRPDGSESETIYLQAPPAGSKMVNPVLLDGRWLTPEDQNALIVSANLLAAEPDIKVGHTIVLELNEKETSWQVTGVVRFAQAVPVAYTNNEHLAQLLGQPGRVTSLRITTGRHDTAFRTGIAEALQAQFTEAGLNVGAVQTISQARMAIDVLGNIIVAFLMSMAVLLAIVGGIGLAGTMSLNVLERIREVGVLRAIGAGNAAVLRVVIFEGVLVGLLSWGLGAILALPVGKVIANAVGQNTLGAPLTYHLSFPGLLLWLALVIAISAIASYFPAQQAANLSVRQVLAYSE